MFTEVWQVMVVVVWGILGEVGFKQFFKVGIMGFESQRIWYEVLFLSLYVFLWEVVENLCKRARVSFYVSAQKYECLEVCSACGDFDHFWVFMMGIFYVVEGE